MSACIILSKTGGNDFFISLFLKNTFATNLTTSQFSNRLFYYQQRNQEVHFCPTKNAIEQIMINIHSLAKESIDLVIFFLLSLYYINSISLYVIKMLSGLFQPLINFNKFIMHI